MTTQPHSYPADRHLRSDLIVMLILILGLGVTLTALKLYDKQTGFVTKFSEKYIERFIQL